MKHLIKTALYLLALIIPATALAHDFEVNGIYYNITGNTATATYKGRYSTQYEEYSGSVIIPATVTYGGTTYPVTAIGNEAFDGCSNLTSINIPNSVNTIGSSAFYNCRGLTSVNIPNSVTSINYSTFYNCSSLTDINIPNSVTTIGIYAFWCCSSLTDINIPNSVTTIDISAFSSCSSLASINIPNSVTTIGVCAFYGCTSLASISVASDNPKYDSRNNCNAIIETATNTLIVGCKNTGIPNSVTIIDEDAFSGCSSLTDINIPNSVTIIGNRAFSYCTNLTDINIPNSVTYIGSSAFYGTAWFNNQPDGLVYAGLIAYEYKGIMPEGTSITLKDGTIRIADFAFDGCSNLTNIIIPNSLMSIGISAFKSCSSLASINVPNSVTAIGSAAFYSCSALTNINIPNSVTTIGNYAFYGCTSLTNINIPNSITDINEGTFEDCTSLTNINIPNSVIYIGCSAFQGCSNLTNINIPNSVIYIGCSAFQGCSNLTNINIPNSVTFIDDYAFIGCTSLTSINIPNSITYIGYNAFSGCSSLTFVNIGNSVTSIVFGAFDNCFSLNDIYCYATTPPECDDAEWCEPTFTNYSATLHVPAASLAAYFTAPVWSKFENIVGDAVAPTGITISRDSVEMQSGEQIELMATVTPANASCQEVTWYSTDTSIARVENGTVTAVGIGECDIYAYCMGMPAICHVSVSNRISLEQNEAMLLPNHMLVLNPIAPAMPAGFTVTSSDPTVAAARVMNGKVQIVGIKEGTTNITVASSDGTAQPATCLVTVYTESGDVDMDGFVNINDVTGLIDYLLGSETTSFKKANADLDGDGNVNINDVTTLIDQLLATSE